MKSMRITWMKSGPATGAGVEAFQNNILSLIHLLMIKPLVKFEKNTAARHRMKRSINMT